MSEVSAEADLDLLFQGLDIESAQDDPDKLANTWYPMTLTDVKPVEYNKKDDQGSQTDEKEKAISITYTVVNSHDDAGKTASDFFPLPRAKSSEDWSSEDKRRASRLKQRLIQLGVPNGELNSVRKSDLLTLELNVKVWHNKGYNNVNEVKVRNDDMDGIDEFR